ncbi:ATP-binding protein [Agitococcus lubricus]|uniref:AAA domain-containing protein n=1 Tax=Agitococcus lubricus TaxID=1077255 RepID=A0A2T5IRX2_9GAMM|nr:ATP-binding protein [Agitococcus lubricus]PTQ86558.1 AAA domain-containing protein [Agitococcus lubricus]
MALKKVIQASQVMRVKALVAYIYADPGIGKTSLAYTAKDAILFDFDAGAHRAGKMRRGATVPVEDWLDVANIESSDVDDYQAVAIDTAGRALDVIKAHLAKNKDNRQKDGSLTIKAQGMANELFKNWIARIRSYGKDVIILAHAAEDKKKDDVIIRPDVGGKNKNELYRQADLMAYLTSAHDEEGKRVRMLNFSPSTAYHAKNSGGLGDVELPDLAINPTFLADLLQQSKDHINSLTDAQVKELQYLDDLENWKNECSTCENANDLNDLIGKIDKEHRFFTEMRQAFAHVVKGLDVEFDKNTGQYFDKNVPSKVPAPVTDPVAANKPEPIEQPTVAPVKVDVIALLRSITNAINLQALKDVAATIPNEGLSDKDKESIKRAYDKRKAELQPLAKERIDEIAKILEMANTVEQLDQTWNHRVKEYTNCITQEHYDYLSTVYQDCYDQLTTQAA